MKYTKKLGYVEGYVHYRLFAKYCLQTYSLEVIINIYTPLNQQAAELRRGRNQIRYAIKQEMRRRGDF